MTASVQRHGAGITWHETDAMARAAHAVRDGERVWLIDPFEDAGGLQAASALGRPAGVIQLLDRHARDGASIARRLGVELLRLPKALPETPFVVVSVIDRPWWHEIALWWPEQRTVIIAEAVGTAPLFALGRRAGVHPLLRAVPPRSALGRYAPERLLVGHGPALDADAAPALDQALASSRSDIPKLLAALPSVIRGR